ncbi:MAG: HD domain-containing protein [Epsilonproteobacteria bacterium]|nr:HD domain-containing protein [Campylobacterota bacterium]
MYNVFFYDKENLSTTDALIRTVSAFAISYIAITYSLDYLWFITAYLVFSSVTRSCIIYHMLGINKSMLKLNYYLNFLPKYNPSPVFIFSINGEISFQNYTSKVKLPEITTIKSFGLYDYSRISSIQYQQESLTYQVNIKFVSQINAFFVYLTDITAVIELQDEIEQTQIEIVELMGMIGETRSRETGNHVRRVAEYSKLLALKLGLSEKEAEIIRIASPMHDIGKVGIPDAILNKPGRLTVDEFEIMKEHATLGYELLKNSDKEILQVAAIIAHEHHEKYNGKGYPRGLKGEAIHIYGRIVAVADVFDALGSERVYKKAWELDRILTLFKEERGESFDPKIIDLLFENLEAFLVIQSKYQDISTETKLQNLIAEDKDTSVPMLET